MSQVRDEVEANPLIDGSRGPVSAGIAFDVERTVKRELLDEVRRSWLAGSPLEPEEALRRWPSDPRADPDVASLLLEDYLQRSSRGEPLTAEHYTQRFPEHKDSLDRLVRANEFLRSLGTCPSTDQGLRLPELNEELFGFHLRHELGRGAFARVYLAEQKDLAGRPVVLKVSGIEGTEPQTLAQLQHTHIVPIFSVHENPRAGLRALCMPYFGGASLSHVLQRLWKATTRPQSGRELLRALEEVAAPAPADLVASEQGPRSILGQLSYIGTAAWIVARLAEGLQHAHQRGVLHRDIKPSNILLGADGQPLLLDFNLAQDSHDATQATLGGTIAYMAPEHLRALATRDPTLAKTIDQRADIYSLGMVLYEMLAGRSPFEQSASYTPLPVLVEAMALERSRTVPSLRAIRPDVSWSLESIIQRCLAPDPTQRYQQAEHLAEDLRRFLADEPLRYAPELSRVEQMRKWFRRHPRLTSSGAVCSIAAVILLAVGLAFVGVRERLADTRVQLEQAQDTERLRLFQEKKVRALFLINTTNELSDHLRLGLRECEEALGLYSILDRADWQEQPAWQRLTAEDRQQLAEDVRELLLLLAGARVRLVSQADERSAKNGGAATTQSRLAVLRAALALLDQAESIPSLPPCRALWADRAAYAAQLGEHEAETAALRVAEQTPPAGARDHYLLAMTLARGGHHEAAIRHLDEAIRLNPRDYWSWVQRGLCHQARGDAVLAVGDFSACVGLWPDFAWGYFNRACALAQCGRKEEALADYTEALRRDAELLPAYINRGLLQLELARDAAALGDFDAALQRGRDDAFLHSGRGVALERLGRHDEADASFRAARERSFGLPQQERDRLRCARAFALIQRDPEQARGIFTDVLQNDPKHAQALYGCAVLCDRDGRTREAICYFDKALASAPEFGEARRFRAVALARIGDFRGAEKDINACLERDPQSGPVLYAAGCIAALIAKSADHPDSAKAKIQAIFFLKQALARGYGREQAGRDSDLDGIRQLPEFRELFPVREETKDQNAPGRTPTP